MPDTSALSQLAEAARAARASAYAPYSKFRVGAAVLLANGVEIKGANIENASFGLTCCAERVAIFSATAQHPGVAIKALAVCAGDDSHQHESDNGRMPCGACRQVMMEFMAADAPIWIDGIGKMTLSSLLPTPFKLRTDT
jgi:cytidine deaminase